MDVLCPILHLSCSLLGFSDRNPDYSLRDVPMHPRPLSEATSHHYVVATTFYWSTVVIARNMLVMCSLRCSTTALSDSAVVRATPDIMRKADAFVSSVSGMPHSHFRGTNGVVVLITIHTESGGTRTGHYWGDDEYYHTERRR